MINDHPCYFLGPCSMHRNNNQNNLVPTSIVGTGNSMARTPPVPRTPIAPNPNIPVPRFPGKYLIFFSHNSILFPSYLHLVTSYMLSMSLFKTLFSII